MSLKLNRLFDLGYNEFSKFKSLVCDKTGVKTKSLKKIFALCEGNENTLLFAEQIVDNIEVEHGIKAGENLLKKSLKRNNNIAWVTEYDSDQLNEWADNKLEVISILCGNREAALNNIYRCFQNECDLRKIKHPETLVSGSDKM